MKALIISGRGVQDQELVYPYYRLQEAGFNVILASPDGTGEFHGIQGVKFTAHALLEDFDKLELASIGIVVVPGGVKCIERLRLSKAAHYCLDVCNGQGAVIAAICSGPLLLASAGLVKGRRVACYPAWETDLRNAGAEVVDAPAVADGRIVTSPHYRHLGAWMSAVLIAAQCPDGFAHG